MQGRVGRWGAVTLATTALCFLAAGCGGDDEEGGADDAGTTTEASGGPEGMLQSIGKGEGRVDLIIWAGYAEDGTTDPKVDWVTDFEEASGCQVNTKVGNTSDEMVTLMRTGNYDGVSASGDATLRLIASRASRTSRTIPWTGRCTECRMAVAPISSCGAPTRSSPHRRVGASSGTRHRRTRER